MKRLHLRKIIFISLFILIFAKGFTQGYISVPLEDPVYNILEYGMIRKYCESMHNVRPYTVKTVLELLNQMLDNDEVPIKEKKIIKETIERLQPKPASISISGNHNPIYALKNGFYVWNTNGKIPSDVRIGASWESAFNTNFNAPALSMVNWLDMYIKGDIGNVFSYNVNAGVGIIKLDVQPKAEGKPDSYAPNTFTQTWDGFLYLLESKGSFTGLTNDFTAGFRFLPEFGLRLWDGKAGISFSRMRRDWGTGDGNLLLSKTARPFTALDIYIRPLPWISLSTLTGSLEYFNSKGIKDSAKDFQNNFTAFMAEVFIKDIAYIGFTSSAIWAKRFELGYLNPGMIPLFYQNNVGDFDNLQFGISFGVNVPKYAKLYYNLFVDEMNPSREDFFHNPWGGMLIWQAGAKIPIPTGILSVFTMQYTKIERYMYTHPFILTPWYGEAMNTSYINHGEPLGYKLKPNSDELKIVLRTIPFWYFNIDGFYTLVHHGVDYGSRKIPGSSYQVSYDEMYSPEAAANPKLYHYKDFLKDGVYEWIHSVGVSGKFDMRGVKNIPLTFRLGYTFSYTHHTEFIGGGLKQVQSSEYKNRFGNYISLSVKVY